MESSEFARLAAVEEANWWHVSRRNILGAEIAKLGLPIDSRILEVGCGTGGNLEMLSAFGRVEAVETEDSARSIAIERSCLSVKPGRLPASLPFPESAYDLVAAFDVVEHVEDDLGAFDRLFRHTRPGGFFVSTVPAYAWMWSSHDVALHHKRGATP